MKLNLFGVIALGLFIAGAVASAALGQPELALVLGGAAGGSLVPQLTKGQ